MKPRRRKSHAAAPLSPNGDFHLTRDPWGQLVYDRADGTQVVGIRPVRLFPLTDPDHWVSLVSPDGGEVLLIEDPQRLSAQMRDLLFEELSQTEFLPVVTRIANISAASSPADWQIETDRGPTRITVSSDDDLRLLGSFGVLIVDAHNTRYLIPDMRTLDPTSQRLLNRHL
jgi:hypothetical protein